MSTTKGKFFRRLFRIHSYTGLLLAVFYFIIAVSGASIVFMDELTDLLYGDNITVRKPEHGPELAFGQLADSLLSQHPGAIFYSLSRDIHYPEHAWTAYSGMPEKTGWFGNGFSYLDYIDPFTGKTIYSGNSNGYHNILGFLDSMHTSLRLGSAGVFIVALVCVAILISLITGFIIYRKSILRVLTFRTRIKFKNWRTASSDLHRVIGTWALLFNLFIFGTGLYMFYPVFTPSWWKEVNAMAAMQPVASVPKLGISIDSMKNRAQELIPDLQVTGFSIACDTSQSVFLFGVAGENLFLNQPNYATVSFDWSGQVKEKTFKTWKEMTAREKFDNSYFTLFHTGWAYGSAGKILWTLAGFTPALLSLTGFLLWLRRKRRPTPKPAR